MSDFRDRLREEHAQLARRIEDLRDFMVTKEYATLAEVDRSDLKLQLRYMEAYFLVLSRRATRHFGGK